MFHSTLPKGKHIALTKKEKCIIIAQVKGTGKYCVIRAQVKGPGNHCINVQVKRTGRHIIRDQVKGKGKYYKPGSKDRVTNHLYVY